MGKKSRGSRVEKSRVWGKCPIYVYAMSQMFPRYLTIPGNGFGWTGLGMDCVLGCLSKCLLEWSRERDSYHGKSWSFIHKVPPRKIQPKSHIFLMSV